MVAMETRTHILQYLIADEIIDYFHQRQRKFSTRLWGRGREGIGRGREKEGGGGRRGDEEY